MGYCYRITCTVAAALAVLGAGEHLPSEVAVDTKVGKVIGTSEPGGVDSFLGIQYAAVGSRFSRSTPITRSLRVEQTIDATQYGPSCYQPNLDEVQDEECLFLNIWRPSGITEGEKLSTMVWIHGGSFAGGSAFGPWYSGAPLALEQNVIVVSLNYRLGIFGFLPTNIDGSGGMNGILDQINALKWVREHIANFGGDPDDVTIFGESAGSYSACVLSVSPLAKGLFRRAIMESLACSHGPIPGATYPYDPLTGYALVTLPLLHAFGYSVDDLLNVSAEFLATHNTPALWPTVDGYVIPKGTYPGELYKDRGNINPIDMIVGSTKNDDAILGHVTPQQYIEMADLAAGVFTMLASFPDYGAADRIIEAYDQSYQANPVVAYAEFIGDWTIRCPSREFASAVAPQLAGNMYLYNYAHFSIADGASVSGLVEAAGIQDATFASHGSEVLLVFGTYDLLLEHIGLDGSLSATPEDVDLSREMMTRWANFAKTGDPNRDGLEEWTPVPRGEDDAITSRATNASTLLLTGGRGRMYYPEEQVEQCSAFPHLGYWR